MTEAQATLVRPGWGTVRQANELWVLERGRNAMEVNQVTLRESKATLEDLEKTLINTSLLAERDGASPGVIYELQNAQSLAERLRYLLRRLCSVD